MNVMSMVEPPIAHFMKVRKEGALAMSATPPDETATGEEHPVFKHMGPLFYKMGYKEAYEQKLISEFEINYLGLILI